MLEYIKKYINEFYTSSPIDSDDYTSIVNENNFNRLVKLIDYDKLYYGGRYNINNLKIEPTILNDINLDDEIMKEEIFGPILPVIEYVEFDDIINIVNKNKNPLALYLFTRDINFENKIINRISFGGGCVNDTIMHITNRNLPFGGIGSSGIGSYHGKKSFETFTHQKSVMKSSRIDIPIKYPPYTSEKLALLKKVFKKF